MFLVGALAFVVASGRYPALELDGILIFIGVVFFLTLGLGMIVERRALRHTEVEALKRIYYGLIPLLGCSPSYFSAMALSTVRRPTSKKLA